MNTTRARWAAVGAAVAVSIGAGGIGVVKAVVEEGPKPIFVPITPCRILDTRTAGDFNTGPRATPLQPNETYVVQATNDTQNGDCGSVIPDAAVGLVMNVTITDPTQNTFVTVYPTGVTRPNASNLNALAGKTEPTPNLVTTDLSANGQFSLYNLQGTTNIFADVAGYYEDHNHDDRYMTDAEVAAQIAAGIADERALIDAEIAAQIADERALIDIELGRINDRIAFVTVDLGGNVLDGTDGITVDAGLLGDGEYTITVEAGTLGEGVTLNDCAVLVDTNPTSSMLNVDFDIVVDPLTGDSTLVVNVTDMLSAPQDTGLSVVIVCDPVTSP